MSDQPYAECKDCDQKFVDRESMSQHLKDTVDPANTSHKATVVNPTEEEMRMAQVGRVIAGALYDAVEYMSNHVDRGEVTAEEIKAQLRYFDLAIEWDEYLEENE